MNTMTFSLKNQICGSHYHWLVTSKNTHSLSICWWLSGKKCEGEDKVENDAKQKDRWEQKISTRFEYRKWVQKMKIKNEYNLNTNQTGPYMTLNGKYGWKGY